MTVPSLLVSFAYLDSFLRVRDQLGFSEWVLDSGAFTAHAAGGEVDLDEYIDTARELLDSDPTLVEVFALDVIGDSRATLRNTERMNAAGIPAIPTYHVGSPEEVLDVMARDYPKIALGGAVGFRAKVSWAKRCFRRVWPKPIHGFGFGGHRAILALPWHSVDATNWDRGPGAFGSWSTFGKLPVRAPIDLRSEVRTLLRWEREARGRWHRVRQRLPDGYQDFNLRLALAGSARTRVLTSLPKEGIP